MRTDGHFVDYPMPIEGAQIPISRVIGNLPYQDSTSPITAVNQAGGSGHKLRHANYTSNCSRPSNS
jgi:hypothetical protein